MPGALTPLSQSVFAQAVEDACQVLEYNSTVVEYRATLWSVL